MSPILRRVFYSLLILIFLVIICFSLALRHYVNTPLLVIKPKIIYVAPGSSIDAVAQTLYTKHVLAYPKLFIWFAKITRQEKRLRSGEYQLVKGMTPKKLLRNITLGKIYFRRFTIVEGWTLKRVLTSMSNNQHFKHTLINLTSADFSKKVGDAHSLEGMFYPDTYLFAANAPDVTILKKAYENMQKKLTTIWANRASDLPYQDPYSALIIASLIEKETANRQDKPKIAGVILRRLEKKMMLQIDASVIYGLGDQYNGKLKLSDLKIETPYNTYLHQGLPPTPISMPSMSSLLAAVHPAKGTALYYVAKGDGSHIFSDTFKTHLLAVNQYRIRQSYLRSRQFRYNFKIIHWFDHPEINLLSPTLDNTLDSYLIWRQPKPNTTI